MSSNTNGGLRRTVFSLQESHTWSPDLECHIKILSGHRAILEHICLHNPLQILDIWIRQTSLKITGQISTCYLVLGKQRHILFYGCSEGIAGQTPRVIFVIDMQSTWIRLKYHISIAMLGTVDDEVITAVADWVL